MYKVVRRDLSEERAIEAVAAMHRDEVVALDESLAIEGADISLAHGLAMADAIVYATALHYRATLVTGNADFEGLPSVVLIR